jgi:FAD/FMN-containing dehydrogenase
LVAVVAAQAPGVETARLQLQARLKGDLLTATDGAYHDAIKVFSPRHNVRPAMVVIPEDVEDVQAAMEVAAANGVPLRVGSGFHNYEGYALVQDGIVVSFRAEHWRRVSPIAADGTVTVGAGAQLIDVHRSVIPQGRGVVAGLCPSVGIVPFALGGGYGSLSRAVGLAADNVVEYTLVLPNGTVTVVNAHTDRDLNWALRGGGGGNFGVVTSLKMKTFPVPGQMVMGETCWFWKGDGEKVFQWWSKLATSDATPRELTVSCRSHWGPLDYKTLPIGAPQQICIQPFYYGTAAEGTRVYREMLEQLPPPLHDGTIAQPWLGDVEVEHAKINALYGLDVYIRSGFFTTMPAQLVDILHAAVATSPSLGNCIIDFDHLGGRIADVAANATAYANRAARTNIQIIATWERGHERADEFKAWADALYTRVEPFMSGNYVNYIDSQLAGWQQKYYGPNYDRLLAIKESVDPQHRFAFQQSIGA